MLTDPVGIVRWAIAAFHANPDADDAALVALLRAAGLPHADRAVTMLPLAFGRRILDGLVDLPATCVEVDAGGRPRRSGPLADDPIYAAADQIARAEGSRDDAERIGLRSAEVRAVNQALHAGAKPEDLVLSPPTLQIDDDAPPVPGVPPAPDAQALIDELVAAHGAPPLSLHARTFPRAVEHGRVQLQLDVVTPVGERWINESFAGLGATIHAALGDATRKFASGSLHVLLAALVDRGLGAGQVEWERWGAFDACLGPLLRMWSDTAPGLGDFLDALRARVVAATLSREVHWLRTFVATDGARILGFDLLLDNDPWPPGVALLQGWPWPASDRTYALRHFLVLVPAT